MDINDSATRRMVAVVGIILVERLVVTSASIARLRHREGGSLGRCLVYAFRWCPNMSLAVQGSSLFLV